MKEQESLSDSELGALIERVFGLKQSDSGIAILTDLPETADTDSMEWASRRMLAWDWTQRLKRLCQKFDFEVALFLYPNVGTNNGDLPASAWPHHKGPLPLSSTELMTATTIPFSRIFSAYSVLIAPTQYSTTAPLKLAAAQNGFRAATMPGFTPAMIPALKLDYREIDRRVQRLKTLLDRATAAYFRFESAAGSTMLELDLRHRTAHASSGLVNLPGTAGNLPSGEAYIVPYEGELPDDPSRSAGLLPVQFDDEVVVFRIEENRAVAIETDGPKSREQARYLAREPAYGNLAELGLGVLSDFGLHPIGQILLDEKLGLHLAFGRSDHFGGQVGTAAFSKPSATVHIDRVYLSETQPLIQVRSLVLELPNGETQPLMRDQQYVL